MRIVVLFLVQAILFAGTAFADTAPACCSGTSVSLASRALAVSSVIGDGNDRTYSSFRGISLGSSPAEVTAIAATLGFEASVSTYVGQDTAVSAIDLCTNEYSVAHADFDRSGQIIRLTIQESFFPEAPVPVQNYAAAIFKRYRVKTTVVADDVCFQDVTCFKGISRADEQFLIMRFGTRAELYVRRADSIKGQ